MADYPHAPYIKAVVAALNAADITVARCELGVDEFVEADIELSKDVTRRGFGEDQVTIRWDTDDDWVGIYDRPKVFHHVERFFIGSVPTPNRVVETVQEFLGLVDLKPADRDAALAAYGPRGT